VRDGNIVTPLGHAQDLLLHEGGGLAQETLGSISQNTEDDFVISLFGDRKIPIRSNRVVVIGLRSTSSKLNSDAVFGSLWDRHNLGVQTNSNPSALHVVLPLGVELALLGEDDHGREVAGQRMVIHGVPCFHQSE
jgi:hypothetical protein